MSVKHVVLRKVAKKVLSVLMATTLLSGCVLVTGCDDGDKDTSKDIDNETVVKPQTIGVMIGDDIFPYGNGREEFEKSLETLLASYGGEGAIDLDIVGPENSRYYERYAGSVSNPWTPDVMYLSYEDYMMYAASGMLWDMTEAWEKSVTNTSGRVSEEAKESISNLYVYGEDGKKSLYGFAPMESNGCCTYVKADWLEKAGIDKSSIEGRALEFSEYYEMLKKLKNIAVGPCVISTPGLVADEPPYTQFLPEFYQDARFGFYRNSAGEYVDGFSEPAMIEALTRIQTAVKEGIINSNEMVMTEEKACEYFCTPDTAKETGVITYWAGRWADKFSGSLQGKKRTDGTTMSGELVALKPIEELGQYVTSQRYVWCITKNISNPQGVFEYFIDTMLDGGDIQKTWQYGAKGTHWDDNTLNYTINHIDPLLTIAPIENDRGLKNASSITKETLELLKSNSRNYERVPFTAEYGTHIVDINKVKKQIVYKVALDPWYSAKQGMQDYKATVGKYVDVVLKSLNKMEEKYPGN